MKNNRYTYLTNKYHNICTPKAKKKAEGQSPTSHDSKINKQSKNAGGYQTQWYLDKGHKDPRKNSKATNIKNPLSMPARETNMIKYYALHRTTGQRLYKYATEGTYVKHPNWASNMCYH